MKKVFHLVAALATTLAMALPSHAANAIYPEWKDGIMSGAANTAVSSCDLRAILVDLADYTYSAAHDFLDDIPAAARVAVSGTIASVTVVAGTLDSDNVTWSSVIGDESEAVVLYCHTGVDATAPLVYFEDSPLSGLPVTPNGGDITYTVNVGGWFTL